MLNCTSVPIPWRQNTWKNCIHLFLKSPLILITFFTLLYTTTFAQGLSFDGTNQYVNCGAVSVTGNNPRTIEAWAYTSSFSNSGGLWQFGTAGTLYGEFSLRTNGSDNAWRLQFWGDDIDVTLPGSKNAWNHFALVYDGTNVKLYYNGNLVVNSAVTLSTVAHDFLIGRWYDEAHYFNGQIDEVRVWDAARTQDEIRASMNTELNGTESNLLAYYKMNEGSGTYINDGSPHFSTGTLSDPPPTWVNGAFVPEGSGTSSSPYQISTLNNLYWISKNSAQWTSYFIQTSDIDASFTSDWNSGQGWSPVGNESVYFRGSYDGQGHTISNLYINRPSQDQQAFFGRAQAIAIQNLGLTNVNITGRDKTAALAGDCAYSVNNCYSTGTVTGTGITGGLIAYGYTITNCYSTANVTGVDNVGGLAGVGAKVSRSFSSGQVSGQNQVGGLLGSNNDYVDNSYSSANVSATSRCGGLVGLLGSGIANCYSTGHVSGTGDYVGGLIGYNIGYRADNSFWDTQTSGQSASGAGTGHTTAEMKSYWTYYNATWDFVAEDNYWGIDESGAQNNGYPFLRRQGYSHSIKPVVTTQAVTDMTATTATGNGTITVLGIPLNPSEHGVCWSTLPNPTTDNSKTTQGSITSTGAFTSSITGLSDNTTYYVRAYATNSAGTNYGEQLQFTTPKYPVVTTQAVTDITPTTATGNGTITDLGIPNPIEHGHCWSTSEYPTTNDYKTTLGAKTTTGTFTSSLTDLNIYKTYYIRAYATNQAGTVYGEQVQFTTLATLPSVKTESVVEITGTTATGIGRMLFLGIPNPTQHGVCWSASQNPTLADSKTTDGTISSYNAFASYITNLSPDRTYYVRAYATNPAGTVYGDQVQFKTSKLAVITTQAVTHIIGSKATGNVTIVDLGWPTPTQYGVCWGTSPNPTTGNSKSYLGRTFSGGSFTLPISNLSPNTTYYLRAYATSQAGTAYGEQVQFTTPGSSYALDFNGANQYAATELPVPVSGTNPRTVEAWVYPRSFNLGGVWQMGLQTDLNEFSLRTGNSDNVWIIQLGTQDIHFTAPGSKNGWNHFAMVYDGTNLKMYLNGNLIVDQIRSLNTIANNFLIGKWGADSFFDGRIDEVRLWNTDRTQEQISSSMNIELSGTEDNLIAYYRMNEGTGTVAEDNSANTFQGILFNSPAWGSGFQIPLFPLNAGNALSFDGVDDYVQLPPVYFGFDDFSVEFWFKSENIGSKAFPVIIGSKDWDGSGDQNGFVITIDYGGDRNLLKVNMGDGRSHRIDRNSTTAVVDGKWHHIAAVFQRSSSFYLYVDGNLEATGLISSILELYTRSIRFGCDGDGGQTYSACTLDEVRLWSTARTAQQIRENMHVTLTGSPAGLIASWKMNEAGGSVAYDAALNYNGPLVNGPSRILSTVPVGPGQSILRTAQSGSYSLGTVNLSLTDPFDNSVSIAATEIGNAPNQLPSGSSTLLSDRYWIVNCFGSAGIFAGNLTFTVPATFTNNGNANASNYTLYRRNSNEDGAWTSIKTGASLTSTSITFNEINSFSQFMLGINDPLPVELVSLTASAENSKVTLHWQTATEVNNYGFDVERNTPLSLLSRGEAEGRGVWEKIGFVQGSGNSNSPKEYSFVDKNPPQGNLEYRLKQIDNDGKFEYSKEVEINGKSVPTEFSLLQNYPNPFNPSTTIKVGLPLASKLQIEVYNILGERVAELVNETKDAGYYDIQWNASSLASGVYFYSIHAKSNDNTKEFREIKKMLLIK